MKELVGLIDTGRDGRSAFDPTLFSTISRTLFTLLQQRGVLRKATGVGLTRVRRTACLAASFRFNRDLWRMQYYIHPSYRTAVTRQVAARLEPGDLQQTFLQIGATFDAPSLLAGRARCYSYNDGCLAESITSPLWPKGLDRRLVDGALEYEKRVQSSMEKVLTFSEYLRQSIIRNYGIPEERVVSIGGGINVDRIPEADPDKRYDRHEVLFIGVDFARKGGWQLLEAFSAVRERLPDAKLHIVGPARIKIPARQAAGVVCHGFLSRHDPAQAVTLKTLFRDCVLFVMPSLYEPYGIAPLEAMAHEIPCLVTDAWALKEIVSPGETGELVACGSVDDLQGKMVRLLSAPDDLRRMGAAGREKVLREHLWNHVVDRLVAHVDLN